MALVGDLASVDLAQVFQVLTQNQKDGVLEVYRGGRPHGLRFRRGAVTLQFDRDDYEERAIELFRRLGRISEEKLHLAAANRASSESALLEILVEMRILSSDDLIILFRERMAEELYDLFAANEGRFEFHEGVERLEGAAGEVDDRFYFPADAVVMEAARRIDEWAQIRQRVPDGSAVFAAVVGEFAPEDDLQAAVFTNIDGARSAANITQIIGRSSFEVHKTIARLANLQVVAPVPIEDYPERGRLAREVGRAREAANLYDLAAAAQVGIPDSIGAAAECWETASEPAFAADRFVTYGDALVESGHTTEALRAYCHAVELVPTNLDAWKKAVLLAFDFEEKHQDAEPAPSPQALAEIFIEIGQGELGVQVLERLVNCRPRDFAGKRALVEALENTGNRKRQCDLLESIAQDLISRGDPMGAAASLQVAMRLQPERKDLSAKIRELYRRDERRRARLRAITAATVILAIVGAVVFYLYSRDTRAKAELAAIDIDAAIRTGGYERARAALEEFREDHKYTFAIADADALIEKVDQAAAEARALDNQKRREEQKVRKQRMDDANALAKSAAARVADGDLPAALTELRRALAVAPPDWDHAQASKQNVADLDQYLTKAGELDAKINEHIRNKEYGAARASIADLIERFPHSPEGGKAQYPVEVHTEPEGAALELDGQPLSINQNNKSDTPVSTAVATPAVVFIAPSKKERSLRATLAGFTPASVGLDAARDERITIRLGRAPDVIIPLPGTVVARAAALGSIIYVPLSGGRLAAFGQRDEALWIVSVAGGGEIAFAPHIDGQGVLVVTNDGIITSLAREDGHILWHASADAAVRVAPAMCSNGVIIASDDGRLRLFDRATGSPRREWRTAARPAGAVAVAEPILAVGLTDGRIQIIDMNNPRTEERFLKFGAPISGMIILDDVVVAGGDDGRIAGYEWQTGRPLWESPGGRIATPRPMIVGERVVIDRGGRIAGLDPHTGAPKAVAADYFEPSGPLAREGNRIIASLRGGSVVSLRADDMAVEWQWPGAAGGALPDPGAVPKRPGAAAPIATTVVASDGVCAAIAGGKIFRFELLGSERASSRPMPIADPGVR